MQLFLQTRLRTVSYPNQTLNTKNSCKDLFRENPKRWEFKENLTWVRSTILSFCAFPSLLITLPRYVKLSTHSSFLPATVRGASKVVLIHITLVFGASISSLTRLAVCQKEIKNRNSKARNAFANLRPVWRWSVYNIRSKLNLYNSIIKSALLYGSECWQVVETDFHKIEAFYNGCLHRIFWIFSPRTISNLELHAKTHSEPIQITIKRRRLRSLGHILRMSHNRIPRVALRWTPQGKRKQDRP